jgi:hypothetical protein
MPTHEGYDDTTLHQFRKDALEVNRTIVSGYKVVRLSGKPPKIELPLYEQLAYLRARSVLNVDSLLREHEADAPQQKIDFFSHAALQTHNWGRYVYWKAIAKVQKYGFERLIDGERVDSGDLETLQTDYQISLEKIAEVEEESHHEEIGSRFPGIKKSHGFFGIPYLLGRESSVDSLRLFEEVVAKHKEDIQNNRTLCPVVELAYRSAYDTLKLKRCFDAIERGASFLENHELYNKAKDAHQWRGLAFWLPVHKVHLLSYERACDMHAPEVEQIRLKELMEWSGEKLAKLETRNLGFGGLDMTVNLSTV